MRFAVSGLEPGSGPEPGSETDSGRGAVSAVGKPTYRVTQTDGATREYSNTLGTTSGDTMEEEE